ncbi:NADPH:quinone oxidoreductase family protein [Sulfitobacter geojensis]|uniref:NADPH:quinone oxidoreductase family protein n=1 Tax=Sulfitobacter geojensis TaxID=1342299 RepID=A0AAE2W1X9_9RHOB|nr:NADPH:quinone oxidoreductase family protein [Sulfitobacter geojensis]MBM1691469.1 NADPH:quinone oxidoreductase family protein [Sulfitobacter geojensis]MBM1695535.1 NADPH:quinone oxidoreductase family protein [Sulfitobacter geojensis]MBM1707723.1 NADPH:quinone oxidoreductase family protein [Sulfitobacter geojensis]MBM1711785.1 NADPH:quinone oxidoreductase family protein [Sulfitobacter geojensis]MBM1715848.1 NADPH:quinone oxidoreductase family protein [Sulfitobacter geojensis]
MKAMLSKEVGGPETLVLEDLPTPEPGKNQVRIKVHAAGVNFPDTLIIRDMYQMKPPRPFAPGGEIAGEVEALGEGVTHLAVGDRVLGMTGFGGFATQVVADAGRVIKIPDSMPYEEAACFVLTYGTSHHALKDRAAIQPGESLLILGAAGGVGVAAIELGKAAGAKVIAAVSSEEKAQFCRDLGADETIIYSREMSDRATQKEFSNEIKKLAGGDGVDVVYDAVGGDYAEPAVRALAWKGRYLVVGFPAGIPKIPLNLTLLKGCQIVGVFWGAHTAREPQNHVENMGDLFRLYGEGKIKPRISASYPLAQAGDALNLLSDRKVLGKVVVTMA